MTATIIDNDTAIAHAIGRAIAESRIVGLAVHTTLALAVAIAIALVAAALLRARAGRRRRRSTASLVAVPQRAA